MFLILLIFVAVIVIIVVIIVLIIVLIVIFLIVIKTFMASPLIKMLPQAAARKENSLESLYFV